MTAKPTSQRATRTGKSETRKQGRRVVFEDIERWPDAVGGVALLASLADTFSRYVALPGHAAVALALWTLHAYALDASFTTPFLCITSPTKRCGKTTCLIVLGALVPRPLYASNVTPAVLFRTIEKYQPALLIDEADSFARDNHELRGILNSGHTHTTARVIRAVGDDHDPRVFSTWCPKAIALIGNLPATLADRAIKVCMRRRAPDEQIDRLRQDRIDSLLLPLRQQSTRWAADHIDQLKEADPAVPAALHDRAADCWRPLLAIADAVGGPWPTTARTAALALSCTEAEDDIGAVLLRDIRDVFEREGNPEAMGSMTIVEHLLAREERPWKEFNHGRPLTPARLTRILGRFGVTSAGNLRVAGKVVRGFRRAAFEDAFSRYLGAAGSLPASRSLPDGGSKPLQRHTANESGLEPAIARRYGLQRCSTLDDENTSTMTGECSAVAVSSAGIQPTESAMARPQGQEVTRGRVW